MPSPAQDPPEGGNQKTGKTGEDLAAAHLRKKGYTILERNFRTRLGEIDIIARHKDSLVFVEVKTRGTRDYGDPRTAVTPAKQRNLTKAALVYLKKNKALQTRARFDVVTVQTQDGRVRIEVIANAFEPCYP